MNFWKLRLLKVSDFSVELLVESIRSRADSSPSELDLLEAKLIAASENLPNLCMCCDSIRRSSDMNHIKERAAESEQHGNNQSPLAKVRHFIGRLAFHVKTAKILVSAAYRLPAFFLD